MIRWTWPGLAAAGLVSAGWVAFTSDAGATYELARAEGTRCATCHVSVRPHAGTLNEVGRYYQQRRSLQGAPGRASHPWGPGRTDEPGVAGRFPPRSRTGAQVYAEACAACHGEKGEGTSLAQPFPGYVPGGPETTALVERIRKGVEGTAMVGFGDVLTDAELAAVADHVVSLMKAR